MRRFRQPPRAYRAFLAQITRMWDSEPHFTDSKLSAIRVPVWIIDGDHDEAIKRENALYMADRIPNRGHAAFTGPRRKAEGRVLTCG